MLLPDIRRKAILAPLCAGVALLLTAASARAEFEVWKTKVGVPGVMEITGLDEGPDGTKVHFRTKGGRDLTVKLEDLQADDQVRAKAWKAAAPKPAAEATFAYATDWAATVTAIDPRIPLLQFVFDLKSDSALPVFDVNITNPTLTVAGKKLEGIRWTGFVYDGSNEFDLETTPPPAPPNKWSVIITAVGNFGKVEPAACEFSADIEVMCGKSPKEVRTTMPLPKGKSTDENPTAHIQVKEAAPFTIRIVKTSYPAAGKADAATGYYLAVMPDDERLDLGDATLGAAFSAAFIANGKEYPWCLYKDQATEPAKVVVKYWSEAYKVPLHLSKAASNKGRTPPRKGAVDGMPR